MQIPALPHPTHTHTQHTNKLLCVGRTSSGKVGHDGLDDILETSCFPQVTCVIILWWKVVATTTCSRLCKNSVRSQSNLSFFPGCMEVAILFLLYCDWAIRLKATLALPFWKTWWLIALPHYTVNRNEIENICLFISKQAHKAVDCCPFSFSRNKRLYK